MPVSPPASDAALVAQALEGEVEAYERLIERHFGAVYAIALAKLRDPEAAEDLTQEVFVRVQLNLRQLGDRECFAPWVCRIARNLATDWLRRGARTSQLVSRVPFETVAPLIPDSTARGACDTMESEEESRILNRAIFDLPDDLREVVLLHFSEGLNQSEIAERLGNSQATVSRQIRRALSALRTSLEPTLRQSAPSLRPNSRALAKSLALAVAIGSMSGSAKAALATSASLSEWSATVQSGAAGAIGVLGFLKSLPVLITGGLKTMGMGKMITAGVVTAAAVAGGVFLHQRDMPAPHSTSRNESMYEEMRAEIQRISANLVAEIPYRLNTAVELVLAEGEAVHLECVDDPNGVEDIWVHVGENRSSRGGTNVNIYMEHASGHITMVGEPPNKGYSRREYSWPGLTRTPVSQRDPYIVEMAVWEVQEDQRLRITLWTLVDNLDCHEARREFDDHQDSIREQVRPSVPAEVRERFMRERNEALQRAIQEAIADPWRRDSLPDLQSLDTEIDESTRSSTETHNRDYFQMILATLRNRPAVVFSMVDNEPVNLWLDLTPGTSWTVHQIGSGETGRSEITFDTAIMEPEESGTIRLCNTVRGLVTGGTSQTPPTEPEVIVLGEDLRYRSGNVKPVGSDIATQLALFPMVGMPNGPVRVGDAWSRDDIPMWDGPVWPDGTSRLERIEMVGGERVAVITSHLVGGGTEPRPVRGETDIVHRLWLDRGQLESVWVRWRVWIDGEEEPPSERQIDFEYHSEPTEERTSNQGQSTALVFEGNLTFEEFLASEWGRSRRAYQRPIGNARVSEDASLIAQWMVTDGDISLSIEIQ